MKSPIPNLLQSVHTEFNGIRFRTMTYKQARCDPVQRNSMSSCRFVTVIARFCPWRKGMFRHSEEMDIRELHGSVSESYRIWRSNYIDINDKSVFFSLFLIRAKHSECSMSSSCTILLTGFCNQVTLTNANRIHLAQFASDTVTLNLFNFLITKFLFNHRLYTPQSINSLACEANAVSRTKKNIFCTAVPVPSSLYTGTVPNPLRVH